MNPSEASSRWRSGRACRNRIGSGQEIPVLDRIDARIDAGEWVALMGRPVRANRL